MATTPTKEKAPPAERGARPIVHPAQTPQSATATGAAASPPRATGPTGVGPGRGDAYSQLHHDLRGCLFTLTAGVRVLQEQSLDAVSSDQMLEYMRESGLQAGKLLDELMAKVRSTACE